MKFGHFYLLLVQLKKKEIGREQFIAEYGAQQQKQGITPARMKS